MPGFKIAIVGSPEAIAGFSLLGVVPHPAASPAEAMETLLALKKETQRDEEGIERPVYAIAFVTEDLTSDLSPEEEKKLARGALPAIIPLPSHRGSTGYGLQRLKHIVERAVGSDILQ